MTRNEIEHMWKVASNNPNHDTNWHDPVVEAFAKLVAKHTLLNTDPSSFMSYQEGMEAGRLAEREVCAKVCDDMEEKAEEHGTECCKWPTPSDCAYAIRARGET
jgi:hypothetical protein